MKMTAKSGATLAAAAAALVMASAVSIPAANASDAKGHCIGANSCKGNSGCKTANSACKGQNECKGKGFVEMTEAECVKIEGAKFEKTS